MYCPTCTRTPTGLGFPFALIGVGVSAAISALKAKGGKNKVSRTDAEKVVRQTYLELLEREPDPESEGYVNCLVEGWCDVDFVRTEVLKSPEYQDLQIRKATAVYAPEAGAYTPTTGGAAPSLASFTSMSIGGIPLPYLLGGVLVLSLLKGRRR